tara:strand:+ start:124 stop:258 length:135 start_codon:yes stop_codon:yes gene_type:complete
MLKDAKNMNEERMITYWGVNVVVPLAIIGLIANFVPYAITVIPL